MNRLIIQYFFTRIWWWALAVVPIAAAVIWSTQPALKAYVATVRMPSVAIDDGGWDAASPLLNARRSVQRSLLQHDLYVPMEDILTGIPPKETGIAPSDASLFMQKACGPSTIYVWIPLKFRLPLYGDYVKEWCWKPPVTKKTS